MTSPPAGSQAPISRKAFRRVLRAIVDDDLHVTRRPNADEASAITPDERVRAVLADELAPGTRAPQALVACVRALARGGLVAEARSLTRAAHRMPSLHEAARACPALISTAQGRFGAAQNRLRATPRESALRLIPAELVAVELATDHRTGVATFGALLGGSRDLTPQTWLDLARHAFARGELGLSDRALGRIQDQGVPLPGDLEAEARWLKRWIALARADRKPEAVPDGQVAVGVLDYKLPDYRRVSLNVGDYIQTVAGLGHLVRHQDLGFHGDPALVDQLEALQARVRPDQRLRGIQREVTVVPVNRDASSLDAIPEGTWMLAFGWYMHRWFTVRYDFPFHPHLRPLFVSFHVNRRRTLSAEGIAYLRKHAPIGCRDWGTVRRLLGLGIPAFFSGCISSTIDLLFTADPPRPADDAPVALVDLPPDAEPPGPFPAARLRHASPEVRDATLPANLDRAVRMLEAYRGDFNGVVTSRLHAYLPLRALGVDVRFSPQREGDIRFDGLVGIDRESFAAMQAGIRDKLELVLSSILSGDDEPAVRAAWREVCEPDVVAARRRVLA